ncbi:MAG: nuclear transport factor 2 family protein [Ilumatobacteraceae bacterium]
MSGLLAIRGAVVAGLVVASCGGRDRETNATTERSEAPPSSASPSVSAPDPTDVPTLFAVGAEELTSGAAAMSDIARRAGEALRSFDAEAAPPTSIGFVVIDPAIPSLRLHSMAGYLSFMKDTIDTAQDVVEVLVNEDGSLTTTNWTSFFHADVAGLDASMLFARQLRVTDGSVTQLMHLMGAVGAADNAEAIAATIGYEGLGVPLQEAVAAIETEAAQACDLARRWAAAWTGHDVADIRALFAADAVRVDGFAGGEQDLAGLEAWASALFAAAPDLTVAVTDVFASGLGPGVVADMTATVNGAPCTVRTGVVWETGDLGLVTREDVYYDPDTLIACGWVR